VVTVEGPGPSRTVDPDRATGWVLVDGLGTGDGYVAPVTRTLFRSRGVDRESHEGTRRRHRGPRRQPGADNHFAAMFACITHGMAALLRYEPAAGPRRPQPRRLLEQRGSHFLAAGRPHAALRCYAAAASMQQRRGPQLAPTSRHRPAPRHDPIRSGCAPAMPRSLLTPSSRPRRPSGRHRYASTTSGSSPALERACHGCRTCRRTGRHPVDAPRARSPLF
jgi:hypothetical protein